MKRIKAKDLGLSIQRLPTSIINVIEMLNKAGYEAYIVGGGVRDMILGHNPKDFDAVTNATPSQIKQVFGKRCRIIGRRFELAHIHSGNEIIEVATFRATPKKALTSATGMILRDNHWGTIEDDFARRDFSINALYYQPLKGEVLDFCGAVKDIQQGKLRLLGNAKQRFEEDPVRMLRAIRFMAKLNFDFDIEILKILNADMTVLLREVSPHRLYDEVQKLFLSGALHKILPLLIHYQLWQHLFQDVPAKITPLMQRAAKNTDLRLQQGKTINPAFFYAIMLWEVFQQRCTYHQKVGRGGTEARIQAGLDVLKRQSMRTVIPRFVEIFIRETWEMQTRLMQPKSAQIMSLLNHTRFRAGFDFLMLREQAKDVDSQGMVDWWEKFQLMNTDEKQEAIRLYQRRSVKKRQQEKAEKVKNNEEKVRETVETMEANQVDDVLEKVQGSQDIPMLDKVEHELLEPLLTDERTQRYQKAQQFRHESKTSREYYDNSPSEKPAITRRKRVKRDLSQVIFGPIR